jgi:hypothetical protein
MISLGNHEPADVIADCVYLGHPFLHAAVNHLTRDAWDLPQFKTAVKYRLGIQMEGDLRLVR